jgi:3-oxoisoapionate kinase
LLLAYYGDDFTGSTDVLEALHSGGVEAVLFVAPPNNEMLQRYAHVRAFGIAGNSRTMSPGEMEQALPEVFRALRSHGPQIVHYKVCSTFDSSPEIGSIGRAIDIGHRIFQNQIVPLVVGAPPLRRYCVFGNLFAKSGLNSAPFRLDRHPTMQRHPVTPMSEADLGIHLSRQTSRPIELIDVLALNDGFESVHKKLDRVQPSDAVVLFDTLTDAHLETIGQVICDVQQHEQQPLFVAGSSGIVYALVKHWQASGIVPTADQSSSHGGAAPISPVDRTVILSGSCSPVTDRQIGWALENGFSEVAIDPFRIRQSKRLEADICAIAMQILSALDSGRSVVAHTGRGPADSRIKIVKPTIGLLADGDRTLGAILSRILREVLRVRPVPRVAVVGGDTAGEVARSLGIEAVEMIGPLEPGAPLCVVRSRDSAIDGLEITFKGGQVGYDDFFGTLLSGRCNHSFIGATS